MIGDRIKEIRKAKGITQKALGDMLSVKESTIRSWETGRNRVKSDVIEKIALALDVHITEFYTDAEYIECGKVSESVLIKLLKQLVELGAIEDANNIPAATMDFINQEVKKEIIRIKNEKDS